jgi:hypothetical protein
MVLTASPSARLLTVCVASAHAAPPLETVVVLCSSQYLRTAQKLLSEAVCIADDELDGGCAMGGEAGMHCAVVRSDTEGVKAKLPDVSTLEDTVHPPPPLLAPLRETGSASSLPPQVVGGPPPPSHHVTLLQIQRRQCVLLELAWRPLLAPAVHA